MNSAKVIALVAPTSSEISISLTPEAASYSLSLHSGGGHARAEGACCLNNLDHSAGSIERCKLTGAYFRAEYTTVCAIWIEPDTFPA
jgi:hypothetical protein